VCVCVCVLQGEQEEEEGRVGRRQAGEEGQVTGNKVDVHLGADDAAGHRTALNVPTCGVCRHTRGRQGEGNGVN
jgi:hypothetical protein